MPRTAKITIRKIYLYKALVDFILLYPLYSIMFASHGLSTFQISTLFIIWAITDLITNVPTGVLADKFSRKKLLTVAPLIEALGFAVWYLWPHYTGYALGFILWGIGGAIFDGTYEALLYDELKSKNLQSTYVRIAGRAQSFALLANFSATALAAIAVHFGYSFIIWGSIVALILAAGVAITLPAAKRSEEVADTKYFTILHAGIFEALHSRVLLEVILLGGFMGAIYGSLEEYIPLFFKQAGFSNSIISILVASTVLVAAVASMIAHYYEQLKTYSFIFLLGLSGLALFAAGTFLGTSSILLLVLYTFLIKLLVTVFDGKVQHSISSNLRATVTSVSLFATEVMSIGTYLLYGILSRHGGNFTSFKVIGLGVMATVLCYILLAPRLFASKTLR